MLATSIRSRDGCSPVPSSSQRNFGQFFAGWRARLNGSPLDAEPLRRAALKAAGMEQEQYALDILSDPPDATTEKGRDLRAFQMAIERLRGAKPQRFLFDVLATGPVPAESAQDYGQVYARGMNEVSDLLGSGKIP